MFVVLCLRDVAVITIVFLVLFSHVRPDKREVRILACIHSTELNPAGRVR